ncbi:MAG: glycosyltransferase, partial [Flavipsychrobacter sp.]
KKSYACTGQSQQIVAQLATSGSQRAHLYRNGVDTRRFDNIRQTMQPQPHNSLRIVYAGLLGVAQGILGLCENIDFASIGAELHIYGEGAEKNDIIAYLEKNKNKGIFLHSSVKRDEVPATIMQYDATLIPLVKPIFGAVPSKIYEAMAAGLPIIFTGGGEGVDIINDNKTGWVCEPGNYEQIKKKIAEVTAMPASELQQIKNNCIYAAQHIFDRRIQIEKLDQFLSK